MTVDITHRAAAGRIARFATPHGTVTTPTLMPVVNPNLSLLSPAQMREKFGTSIVITNSYVIRKHERLREAALQGGVHKLIGWDGPVMTDSGTFQMYVYGDVDVPPEEIVPFQRDIGVDVATCMDLFVTPEMERPEAEAAVRATIARTREATAQKRGRGGPGTDGGERATLLNATVQGGVFPDLREQCARAYRDLDVDYHTIGGVVPLMEQQRYGELVEAILASQRGLRKDRPVHLFGAGHPLVFPLAVALGCDLFDSSSYAKYAKDGRMMFEWGTSHLTDLEELPCTCPPCSRHGAAGLKALPAKERETALAEHNLHVSFSDLRRIRTAIREGTLWELVEQRAACHPLLAAATRRLGHEKHQAWLEAREPLSGARAVRYTGSLTHRRPLFARVQRRLLERVVPQSAPVEVPASDYAPDGGQRIELGMHKEPESKPYRDRLGTLDPDMDHAVVCAFGPVPLGLDECYPFAQSVLPRLDGLDREHMGWVGQTKDLVLERHGMVPALPGPGGKHGRVDLDVLQVVRTADWQFGAGAGAALTGGLAPRVEGGGPSPFVAVTDDVQRDIARRGREAVAQDAAGVGLASHGLAAGNRDGAGHDSRGPAAAEVRLRIEKSRNTDKIRTVHLGGQHVLSLRAGDGLFTLKLAGAELVRRALPAPANRVVVAADSVPFNRAGKSVFAQFVRTMDPDLRPYDECLVVDEQDSLVAVGNVVLAPDEVGDFRKGMAVKVREGRALQGAVPATATPARG